jgi:hypothetical protein
MDTPTTGFGWTPSGSTNASSVGGALAIVIVSVCSQRHWFDFDPVTATALGVILSAVLGYLPQSGRLPKG